MDMLQVSKPLSAYISIQEWKPLVGWQIGFIAAIKIPVKTLVHFSRQRPKQLKYVEISEMDKTNLNSPNILF